MNPVTYFQEFTMMKSLLASCSLLAVLVVSSLPVRAQTSTPAPANKPSSTAKPAPSASPSAPQANISADELKKFAVATKQLLAIVNETESQMVQAVQKQGLTETRFNEIYQSKKNPAAKPATQITPKEEASYNQAVGQLTKLQEDARAKMDKAVEAQGFQMERFNQIFVAVQNDPKLRQEVRKMIQNPQ